MKFQQCPVRNENVIGAQVYSHSGEFSPRVVDFGIPGRGISFQFVRKYRIACSQEICPIGRGWTFTYAKRIEHKDNDVLYHDGLGRTHRFAGTRDKNKYGSPKGFYSILIAENGKFLLGQRYGTIFHFEKPEAGGRLLAIEDRNKNVLKFEYTSDVVRVTDTLGRRITIIYERDRVSQVEDHVYRVWQYKYNAEGCLIEVVQPPTDDFLGGPRIRYGYDNLIKGVGPRI